MLKYAYLPLWCPLQMMDIKKAEKLCTFDPLPGGNIIHLFLIHCNQHYLFLIFFLKEIDKGKIKYAFSIGEKIASSS